MKSTVTGYQKSKCSSKLVPKVQQLANTITELNNSRQAEGKTGRQTRHFSHGKTDRPI